MWSPFNVIWLTHKACFYMFMCHLRTMTWLEWVYETKGATIRVQTFVKILFLTWHVILPWEAGDSEEGDQKFWGATQQNYFPSLHCTTESALECHWNACFCQKTDVFALFCNLLFGWAGESFRSFRCWKRAAQRAYYSEILSGLPSSWYCGLAFTYLPKYGQANLQFSDLYGSVGICCAAVWMFDTSGTISELKQAPTGNNLQMDLFPKVQQRFLSVWTLSTSCSSQVLPLRNSRKPNGFFVASTAASLVHVSFSGSDTNWAVRGSPHFPAMGSPSFVAIRVAKVIQSPESEGDREKLDTSQQSKRTGVAHGPTPQRKSTTGGAIVVDMWASMGAHR